MADLTLNLGITNPIPLNLTVDQPQLNFTVAPIVVSFVIGGGSSGGGGGSVNSVTVASPLSTALTFANPTTNPALTIQNAAPNANTKFLRGDGTWAVPAGAVAGVTSVALAAPAEFTVSGSPITSAGTITLAKANQNINLVYAGPASGAAAAPTFRALVNADLPAAPNQNANLVYAGPASGAAAAPTFRSLVAADLPASAVVTRIIAGSNITISPTTGVGAVTVNSTGGSGGGGGTGWTSASTIAVGDVFMGASSITDMTLAGATRVFDGSTNVARYFSTVTATPGVAPVACMYGNNRFLILQQQARSVFTSPGGLVWTAMQTNIVGNIEFSAVAKFLNGLFWVYSSSANGFYTSSDGVTWTSLANFTGTSTQDMSFFNSLYLFPVTGSNGPYWYSTDGTNFTQRNFTTSGNVPIFSQGAQFSVNSTAFGNGVWVVASRNNGIIGTSTDPTVVNNWTTAASLGSSVSFINCVFGNNVFVAITLNGQIYYSDATASTWTRTTPTYVPNNFGQLTFVNGTFVIPSATPNQRAIYSTDGINWTPGGVSVNGVGANLTASNGTVLLGVPSSLSEQGLIDYSFNARSLYVLDNLGGEPVAAPNGTYRNLGGLIGDNRQGFWTRTA